MSTLKSLFALLLACLVGGGIQVLINGFTEVSWMVFATLLVLGLSIYFVRNGKDIVYDAMTFLSHGEKKLRRWYFGDNTTKKPQLVLVNFKPRRSAQLLRNPYH